MTLQPEANLGGGGLGGGGAGGGGFGGREGGRLVGGGGLEGAGLGSGGLRGGGSEAGDLEVGSLEAEAVAMGTKSRPGCHLPVSRSQRGRRPGKGWRNWRELRLPGLSGRVLPGGQRQGSGQPLTPWRCRLRLRECPRMPLGSLSYPQGQPDTPLGSLRRNCGHGGNHGVRMHDIGDSAEIGDSAGILKGMSTQVVCRGSLLLPTWMIGW